MGAEADYKEPTNGAKRAIALALTGIVLAGLGWADSAEKGKTLAAYKAELAAAGLDPSNAKALNLSIATKTRALTEVENALVSASAAANFRAAQVAALTSDVAAIEAKADGLAKTIASYGVAASSIESVSAGIAAKKRQLVDVENALVATTAAQNFRAAELGVLAEKSATVAGRLAEASAKAEALEAENRALGPKVAGFQNEVVAAEAAARARRSELDGLIAEVEKNQALVAAATDWAINNKALTAKNETLGRQVIDVENKLTSLIAAVSFRQTEISKIMVAMNDAQTDEQSAKLNALNYRAEVRKLTDDIAALAAERKQVEAALIDVNNRFVPALAAVTARESQLQKLSVQVGTAQQTFEALNSKNLTMEARLQEADGRLLALASAAHTAAQHLAEIDKLFEKPTVQAALTQN